MALQSWDADRKYHNSCVARNRQGISSEIIDTVHRDEISTTPLFSGDVLKRTLQHDTNDGIQGQILPEYGFLGSILEKFDGQPESQSLDEPSSGDRLPVDHMPTVGKEADEDDRLFMNMNAPWSAFLCGSQGSGKSYTLTCMLENALKPSGMGPLPNPLSGMVFHYDTFISSSSSQVCEAAYLASSGIPVKILVSPSNFPSMKKAYAEIPGFPANVKKPVVAPLFLTQDQLDVAKMMKLMAVEEKDGKMPLYMEVRRRKTIRVRLVLTEIRQFVGFSAQWLWLAMELQVWISSNSRGELQ